MPNRPIGCVVALVLSGEERRQLAASLASTSRLRDCARAGDLLRLASQSGVSAVVAELRDSSGASTFPDLLALQRERPSLPIVVVLSLTQADARVTLGVVRAGLRAVWVIRHFERLDVAVAAALAADPALGPETAILQAVGPVVHPTALPFFVFGAAAAARPITVADAARVLGISSRALEMRLKRVGLSPPREVLACCRALHAAWRLDVLGQSSKQVTAGLGFPSPSALCKLVVRFAGVTPRQVRERGGFLLLLDEFVSRLAGGNGEVVHARTFAYPLSWGTFGSSG